MAGTRDHPPAVALVGFMGAGKSAVGRELAVLLGIPFVDTDHLVVSRAGPIEAIFAERGEAAFRALETEVVVTALADARGLPCVLALGGGAVLSADVREALGGLRHRVWLTAPSEVLWERARFAGQPVRPLAADEAAFRALLAAREPLYRQVATMVVDTAGGSPEAVAAGIASRVQAPATDAAGRQRQGGAR